MPCRMDTLAFGVLAALLWRNDQFREHLASRERMFNMVCIVLGLGAFCLLVWWPKQATMTSTIGYTWLAMLYAVYLLSVLNRPDHLLAKWLRMSWLRSLGRVSYCIYIIHQVVDTVLHSVLLKSSPRVSTTGSAAVTLLAVLVTYVVARLSWEFFEQPLLKRGYRFKYAPPDSLSN